MTDQPAPHHVGPVEQLYHHVPVPHIAQRRQHGPAKVHDQMKPGFNGRLALWITNHVGTMACAYIFCMIAIIGAYAIIANNSTLNLVIILISQTFLQLVLLPIIIVGQNLQSAAADKRSDQTYKDAEAILNECLQLQQHLQAQDRVLDDIISHLHGLQPQPSAAQ